jgi:hypothetical protein
MQTCSEGLLMSGREFTTPLLYQVKAASPPTASQAAACCQHNLLVWLSAHITQHAPALNCTCLQEEHAQEFLRTRFESKLDALKVGAARQQAHRGGGGKGPAAAAAAAAVHISYAWLTA